LWAAGHDPEGRDGHDVWDERQRLAGEEYDPAAAAELADDLATMHRAVADLSPKRRAAIVARFGLVDGEVKVGKELARHLGVVQSSAHERLKGALAELALAVGADPEYAAVDHAEGLTLGLLAGRTPQRRRRPRKRRDKKRRCLRPADVAG
jgi:hypothetical protein